MIETRARISNGEVRLGSCEFEQWRRGLEAVTRRISHEDLRGLPDAERSYELSRRFRDEVLELQRGLNGSLASSPPLHRRILHAGLKFGLGAIFGGATGAAFGAAVAAADVAKDLSKAIGESLAGDVKKTNATAAQRALVGMFVAFELGD